MMSDSLFSVTGNCPGAGGTRGISLRGRGLRAAGPSKSPPVANRLSPNGRRRIAENERLPRPGAMSPQSQIDQLVAAVVAKYGRIDTLVNVAGVNRPSRPPGDEEDWDFVIDTNLRGAFFMSQAVGKQMVAQGGGSQIQICSLNNYGPLPWVLPYAASKAAVGHNFLSPAAPWCNAASCVRSMSSSLKAKRSCAKCA
jgi:NAD(P)-dependent dehydrogenase (short-subunit alcohol dehydrogenase family)